MVYFSFYVLLYAHCCKYEANPVLCIQCGNWIHGRCAGVESVTTGFSRNFACKKCEGNIGKAVQQKESCHEEETVREFTYLGCRVSAGEGCVVAVTARTRYGLVKLRKCGKLLYGRFSLKLTLADYKGYVWPAILYGMEALCLKVRWEFHN